MAAASTSLHFLHTYSKSAQTAEEPTLADVPSALHDAVVTIRDPVTPPVGIIQIPVGVGKGLSGKLIIR